MTVSSGIYFDYSGGSLSSRWDSEPPPKPTRRILLSHPDGVKSPGLGGPPNYHPAAMSHSERKLLAQKPLYAAPLAYYALKALQPWFCNIGPSEQLLSAQSSVSITPGDERANLGNVVAPWAQRDISRLDPPTWAFLIQNYHDLPDHYSRYRLALNDPHLLVLSALPSTPRFSIITVLDLSKCADLHDTNISQLKVLNSLCVFDTSSTGLTDQGVKNLKSTLLVSEPGPLHLRSWSLRDCPGITNRVLESLAAFPLLCVIDLRNTSVKPPKVPEVPLIWENTSLLSPGEHPGYFWPSPQDKIPALLQGVESSVFPHSARQPKPIEKMEEPYIVHVDRQAPRQLIELLGSYETVPVSRVNRNTYLVDGSYGQTVEPEAFRAIRDRNRHLDQNSYQDYDDEDCYEYDGLDDGYYWGYTGSASDSGAEGSISGGSQRESTSEISAEDVEIANAGSITPNTFHQAPSPGFSSSTFDSDDELATLEQPTPADNTNAGRSTEMGSAQSSERESSPTPSVADSTISSQDSYDESDALLLASTIMQEHTHPEPGVSHFYNARAQAGLAPPQKRKRHTGYSSQSCDSETEPQAFSTTDLQLMLVRKPPPWSTTELLAASVFQNPTSHQQVKSQPLIAVPAKKRKVDANGAMALWSQIKASRNKPGGPPSRPAISTTSAPSDAPLKSLSQTPLLSQRVTTITQPNSAPARRTPLGRAPRAPGSITRKFK